MPPAQRLHICSSSTRLHSFPASHSRAGNLLPFSRACPEMLKTLLQFSFDEFLTFFIWLQEREGKVDFAVEKISQPKSKELLAHETQSILGVEWQLNLFFFPASERSAPC